MKRVTTFLTLLLFGLAVSSASAATYYVDELLGNDSNAGSQAAPWATIQKAADVMVAGDKAIVVFGTYAESVVPKNNGTVGNPIVYMAAEKGEAEITTGDPVLIPTLTVHSGSIYVAGDIFRKVTNLSEDGNFLTGKDHLDSLAAGTWFQNRADAKLYVWSSDDADPATHADTVFFAELSFDIVGGSYITIDGFTIKNRLSAEVADNVSHPGLVITNNSFELEDTSATALKINGGAADSVHTYEGFLIDNNVFENNGTFYIYSAGRNSVISDNTFNGSHVVGRDVKDENIRLRGSSDYPGVQCQGLVIERNFFNDNDGRCLYFRYNLDSVTVQNNIFYKGDFLTIQVRDNAQNIDFINNTFFYNGRSHLSKIYAGCSGRVYNNIFAYSRRSYTWFHDNKSDTTGGLQFEIDHNYYVTDTSLTSSRDDQLLRLRVGPNGDYVNSSKLPGGPHAVYGHPMVTRADLSLVGDTLFTPVGDTVSVDSERVLMTGESVVVVSVPDMWFQDAYPLFDSDTANTFAAATAEDFKLAAGSNAIDAAYAALAPELDFFGTVRGAKSDIGAIEFEAGVAIKDALNLLFPQKYELSQNYPNPFNITTRIDYALPKAGYVRLTIYNLLGQKVATLVNGIRTNGTHSILWNGLDDSGRVVPSGIYIYSMEAGSVSKTAKMVLLK